MIALESKFNSGTTAYGIQRFICDTPDDVPNLSTTVAQGSTAFIISTSERYMLNGQGQWIKIISNGGGTIDPDITYIYDGGIIE